MEFNKLSDFLVQVFSRFLISGLVFYLFVIGLPSFWFLGINGNFITNNFTVIIMVSLVIGILLDICKFYRISWKIINQKKKNLKKNLEYSIVNAFHIESKLGGDKNYQKRINKLARYIHEIFIKTKHPDIYQRIGNARIYPDIISMALLCVIIFCMECIFFFFYVILFPNLYQHPTIPLNYSPYVLVLFIILSGYIFFKGIGKVREKYLITTDFTKYMIEEGYYESDDKNKERFFKNLEEEHLIFFDEEKHNWKVWEER